MTNINKLVIALENSAHINVFLSEVMVADSEGNQVPASTLFAKSFYLDATSGNSVLEISLTTDELADTAAYQAAYNAILAAVFTTGTTIQAYTANGYDNNDNNGAALTLTKPNAIPVLTDNVEKPAEELSPAALFSVDLDKGTPAADNYEQIRPEFTGVSDEQLFFIFQTEQVTGTFGAVTTTVDVAQGSILPQEASVTVDEDHYPTKVKIKVEGLRSGEFLTTEHAAEGLKITKSDKDEYVFEVDDNIKGQAALDLLQAAMQSMKLSLLQSKSDRDDPVEIFVSVKDSEGDWSEPSTMVWLTDDKPYLDLNGAKEGVDAEAHFDTVSKNPIDIASKATVNLAKDEEGKDINIEKINVIIKDYELGDMVFVGIASANLGATISVSTGSDAFAIKVEKSEKDGGQFEYRFVKENGDFTKAETEILLKALQFKTTHEGKRDDAPKIEIELIDKDGNESKIADVNVGVGGGIVDFDSTPDENNNAAGDVIYSRADGWKYLLADEAYKNQRIFEADKDQISKLTVELKDMEDGDELDTRNLSTTTFIDKASGLIYSYSDIVREKRGNEGDDYEVELKIRHGVSEKFMTNNFGSSALFFEEVARMLAFRSTSDTDDNGIRDIKFKFKNGEGLESAYPGILTVDVGAGDPVLGIKEGNDEAEVKFYEHSTGAYIFGEDDITLTFTDPKNSAVHIDEMDFEIKGEKSGDKLELNLGVIEFVDAYGRYRELKDFLKVEEEKGGVRLEVELKDGITEAHFEAMGLSSKDVFEYVAKHVMFTTDSSSDDGRTIETNIKDVDGNESEIVESKIKIEGRTDESSPTLIGFVGDDIDYAYGDGSINILSGAKLSAGNIREIKITVEDAHDGDWLGLATDNLFIDVNNPFFKDPAKIQYSLSDLLTVEYDYKDSDNEIELKIELEGGINEAYLKELGTSSEEIFAEVLPHISFASVSQNDDSRDFIIELEGENGRDSDEYKFDVNVPGGVEYERGKSGPKFMDDHGEALMEEVGGGRITAVRLTFLEGFEPGDQFDVKLGDLNDYLDDEFKSKTELEEVRGDTHDVDGEYILRFKDEPSSKMSDEDTREFFAEVLGKIKFVHTGPDAEMSAAVRRIKVEAYDHDDQEWDELADDINVFIDGIPPALDLDINSKGLDATTHYLTGDHKTELFPNDTVLVLGEHNKIQKLVITGLLEGDKLDVSLGDLGLDGAFSEDRSVAGQYTLEFIGSSSSDSIRGKFMKAMSALELSHEGGLTGPRTLSMVVENDEGIRSDEAILNLGENTGGAVAYDAVDLDLNGAATGEDAAVTYGDSYKADENGVYESISVAPDAVIKGVPSVTELKITWAGFQTGDAFDLTDAEALLPNSGVTFDKSVVGEMTLAISDTAAFTNIDVESFIKAIKLTIGREVNGQVTSWDDTDRVITFALTDDQGGTDTQTSTVEVDRTKIDTTPLKVVLTEVGPVHYDEINQAQADEQTLVSEVTIEGGDIQEVVIAITTMAGDVLDAPAITGLTGLTVTETPTGTFTITKTTAMTEAEKTAIEDAIKKVTVKIASSATEDELTWTDGLRSLSVTLKDGDERTADLLQGTQLNVQPSSVDLNEVPVWDDTSTATITYDAAGVALGDLSITDTAAEEFTSVTVTLGSQLEPAALTQKLVSDATGDNDAVFGSTNSGVMDGINFDISGDIITFHKNQNDLTAADLVTIGNFKFEVDGTITTPDPDVTLTIVATDDGSGPGGQLSTASLVRTIDVPATTVVIPDAPIEVDFNLSDSSTLDEAHTFSVTRDRKDDFVVFDDDLVVSGDAKATAITLSFAGLNAYDEIDLSGVSITATSDSGFQTGGTRTITFYDLDMVLADVQELIAAVKIKVAYTNVDGTLTWEAGDRSMTATVTDVNSNTSTAKVTLQVAETTIANADPEWSDAADITTDYAVGDSDGVLVAGGRTVSDDGDEYNSVIVTISDFTIASDYLQIGSNTTSKIDLSGTRIDATTTTLTGVTGDIAFFYDAYNKKVTFTASDSNTKLSQDQVNAILGGLTYFRASGAAAANMVFDVTVTDEHGAVSADLVNTVEIKEPTTTVPGGFDIAASADTRKLFTNQIVFSDETLTMEQFFNEAASFWEHIIGGHSLATDGMTLTENFVIGSIGTNYLATASSDSYTSTGSGGVNLPTTGTVTFSNEYFTSNDDGSWDVNYKDYDYWLTVLKHEIGHHLGFAGGVIDRLDGSLVANDLLDEGRHFFKGKKALAEFQHLFFSIDAQHEFSFQGVPMQGAGFTQSFGVDNHHLDRMFFYQNLMEYSMSDVTRMTTVELGMLMDMGYELNSDYLDGDGNINRDYALVALPNIYVSKTNGAAVGQAGANAWTFLASEDSDGDGLTNYAEYILYSYQFSLLGAKPNHITLQDVLIGADADGDGITDLEELYYTFHSTDGLSKAGTSDNANGNRDLDGDGLFNWYDATDVVSDYSLFELKADTYQRLSGYPGFTVSVDDNIDETQGEELRLTVNKGNTATSINSQGGHVEIKHFDADIEKIKTFKVSVKDGSTYGAELDLSAWQYLVEAGVAYIVYGAEPGDKVAIQSLSFPRLSTDDYSAAIAGDFTKLVKQGVLEIGLQSFVQDPAAAVPVLEALLETIGVRYDAVTGTSDKENAEIQVDIAGSTETPLGAYTVGPNAILDGNGQNGLVKKDGQWYQRVNGVDGSEAVSDEVVLNLDFKFDVATEILSREIILANINSIDYIVGWDPDEGKLVVDPDEFIQIQLVDSTISFSSPPAVSCSCHQPGFSAEGGDEHAGKGFHFTENGDLQMPNGYTYHTDGTLTYSVKPSDMLASFAVDIAVEDLSIDLNGDADGVDNAVTYPSADSAHIAPNAEIKGVAQDAGVSELSIGVGGVVQAGDTLTFALGQNHRILDLNNDGSLSFSYNGTTFHVQYQDGTITINNEAKMQDGTAASMPAATLESLIQAITVQNNQSGWSGHALTFDIVFTDANGVQSAASMATVNFISPTAPVVDLDGQTNDVDAALTVAYDSQGVLLAEAATVTDNVEEFLSVTFTVHDVINGGQQSNQDRLSFDVVDGHPLHGKEINALRSTESIAFSSDSETYIVRLYYSYPNTSVSIYKDGQTMTKAEVEALLRGATFEGGDAAIERKIDVQVKDNTGLPSSLATVTVSAESSAPGFSVGGSSNPIFSVGSVDVLYQVNEPVDVFPGVALATPAEASRLLSALKISLSNVEFKNGVAQGGLLLGSDARAVFEDAGFGLQAVQDASARTITYTLTGGAISQAMAKEWLGSLQYSRLGESANTENLEVSVSATRAGATAAETPFTKTIKASAGPVVDANGKFDEADPSTAGQDAVKLVLDTARPGADSPTEIEMYRYQTFSFYEHLQNMMLWDSSNELTELTVNLASVGATTAGYLTLSHAAPPSTHIKMELLDSSGAVVVRGSEQAVSVRFSLSNGATKIATAALEEAFRLIDFKATLVQFDANGAALKDDDDNYLTQADTQHNNFRHYKRIQGDIAMTVTANDAGGNEDTAILGLQVEGATDVTLAGSTNAGTGLDDLIIMLGEGDSHLAYFGSGGTDTIMGSDKNDRAYGGVGDDKINGGAGNDVLYGEAGDDTLSGDDGNDRLDGGDGADTLNGGLGDDFLVGGAGADSLFGGDGNDIIDAADDGVADVKIDGGAGNDTLFVDLFDLASDTTTIDGGEGYDEMVVDLSGEDAGSISLGLLLGGFQATVKNVEVMTISLGEDGSSHHLGIDADAIDAYADLFEPVSDSSPDHYILKVVGYGLDGGFPVDQVNLAMPETDWIATVLADEGMMQYSYTTAENEHFDLMVESDVQVNFA